MKFCRRSFLSFFIPFFAVVSWLILASPFSDKSQDEPDSNAGETAEVVFPVDVSIVRRANLIKCIVTNGIVQPKKEAEIIARVGGEIIEVRVANGEFVEGNAMLFKINDREYRLAYERTQASLLQAQIDYKTMSSYEEFIDDTTNREEMARLATEKFQETARRYRQGALPLEEFQRARRQFETDSSFYGAHREDVMANRSGLAAARESFGRAKLNLESTKMKAPFGGYVADCDISVGQQVRTGQSVMKIVDLSTLLVDVDVLEDEIGGVNVGATAEVTVNAFPDRRFVGHVKTVNPIVDPKSKAVRVTIELKDGRDRRTDGQLGLRPGMFATVEIETQIFRDRILAPKSALLVRDQRPLVFVAEHGLAKWHYIELGEENEEFIEIRSGVNAGDSVIVDGHYTLAHDAKIRIRGN